MCSVLCSRYTQKDSRLRRRNSRQFFDAPFLLAGYSAAVLLRKNVICMDGTLANFFLRPLLDCLRGSTPHGDDVTYCYDFPSKRFHFDTILRLFWGPKRSCELIPGSWDQSGGQGAPKAKITQFYTPCFGTFLDKFSFRVENISKIYQKIMCWCPVYFLNDF